MRPRSPPPAAASAALPVALAICGVAALAVGAVVVRRRRAGKGIWLPWKRQSPPLLDSTQMTVNPMVFSPLHATPLNPAAAQAQAVELPSCGAPRPDHV